MTESWVTGLFDNVNAKVGEISVQAGMTPAAWNAGVFSLIRQLSETVVLPIAGLILTFVAAYELIQMLIDRNNLHELDTWIFFKWIFKTGAAVLILSNTFNIVMGVFDVSQSVIAQAAGLVQGSTDITPDMLSTLQTTFDLMFYINNSDINKVFNDTPEAIVKWICSHLGVPFGSAVPTGRINYLLSHNPEI